MIKGVSEICPALGKNFQVREPWRLSLVPKNEDGGRAQGISVHHERFLECRTLCKQQFSILVHLKMFLFKILKYNSNNTTYLYT